ncbi:hypothetical protein B0H34DRAFT_516509 [Crassisporium funariophilum]|nr:hypothetical protein B0H34DRAFT_516509 [Crassisporium funariophilum]
MGQLPYCQRLLFERNNLPQFSSSLHLCNFQHLDVVLAGDCFPIKQAARGTEFFSRFSNLTKHTSQMDSFTAISVSASIPTNEETGGSGNNAYCVVA